MSSRQQAVSERAWSVLSAQGQVLMYIALCPGCTRSEMATGLSITERAVWNVLAALRNSGVVKVLRRGRTNHHVIDLDSQLLIPGVGAVPTRKLLGGIVEASWRKPNPICRRVRRRVQSERTRRGAAVAGQAAQA